MNNDISDPMAILPIEIQTIIKRKSSRDPSSRFASKLHLLLSYVSKSGDPSLEEKVGCGWVNDEEFKLNKRTICQVLGIKLNTLNVNLHALQFNQQKHNKDGWTLWRREGFTRNSPDIAEQPSSSMNQKMMKNPNTPSMLTDPSVYSIFKINLGQTNPYDNEMFTNEARQMWIDFGNTDINSPAMASDLIRKAALKFKQPEQPLSNAIEVLQAIMAPDQTQPTITFFQFAKLLAMFGPKDTIMLKIASLLSCSNTTGQWLFFSKIDQPPMYYGTFSDEQPNCLILCQQGRPPIRVWNMPLVDATNPYIKNETEFFNNWEDYFDRHPFNSLTPDFPQY